MHDDLAGAPREARAPEAVRETPPRATETVEKEAAPGPSLEEMRKKRAAVPEIEQGARIGALGPHTWIWKKPERKGLATGKMRIGTSVKLKSTSPVDGVGCSGKWYAIEPRGYVCDDETATLDLKDPYYLALRFSAPDPGVWPYGYGHSNGAPMYSRVPTPEEWKKEERDYGPVNTWKPLGAWAIGHEENIVDEPIAATDDVPYFLKDGKRTAPGGNFHNGVLVWRKIPAGSMLAFSRAFEANGRVWLLTPDTMVVPADRVSKMLKSEFQGVHFDKSDMRLPFAWNRSKAPLPKYKKLSSGVFEATSETIAAKAPIEIDDAPEKTEKMIYFPIRKEPGLYVGKPSSPDKELDGPVSITRRATKRPRTVAENEKWIEAKVVPGTLTAYVGDEPVFATLFSPGKGGPPPPDPDHDHEKYATTALGMFPLEWKERVATMSNENGVPKVLWFTDVPHQQYLKAPLAMHVTYWHQDFGKRKSAECLNVSPIDGAYLFGFTDPPMPEGWNAIGAGQGNGKSTPVLVTAN